MNEDRVFLSRVVTKWAGIAARYGLADENALRRAAQVVLDLAGDAAPDVQRCAIPGCRNPLPPYSGQGRPRKYCTVCSPRRRP